MLKIWSASFVLVASLCVIAVEPQDCDESGLPKLSVKARESELDQIAKKSKDTVVHKFIVPSQKTCSSLTYEFPEKTLAPGESLYFHVPLEYRNRGVRFMVLGHRQDPLTNKNVEWDDKPGLSSVQVYSKGIWSYWRGSASGNKGAKFAEIRSYPEMENLYDWDSFGHANAKNSEPMEGDLLPEAIKIESVGKDKVIVSSITLKIAPPKEKDRDEKIFTPGTSFTSADGKEKYRLGGGQAHGGKFPKAKVLKFEEYTMPLSSDRKISSIEVAAGDSHPDGVTNKDGGTGTPGWAKISIGIRNKLGQTKWLLSHENVPPEGIITASPGNCDDKVEAGSVVVIKGHDDSLYLMGVKVGYQ